MTLTNIYILSTSWTTSRHPFHCSPVDNLLSQPAVKSSLCPEDCSEVTNVALQPPNHFVNVRDHRRDQKFSLRVRLLRPFLNIISSRLPSVWAKGSIHVGDYCGAFKPELTSIVGLNSPRLPTKQFCVS